MVTDYTCSMCNCGNWYHCNKKNAVLGKQVEFNVHLVPGGIQSLLTLSPSHNLHGYLRVDEVAVPFPALSSVTLLPCFEEFLLRTHIDGWQVLKLQHISMRLWTTFSYRSPICLWTQHALIAQECLYLSQLLRILWVFYFYFAGVVISCRRGEQFFVNMAQIVRVLTVAAGTIHAADEAWYWAKCVLRNCVNI